MSKYISINTFGAKYHARFVFSALYAISCTK